MVLISKRKEGTIMITAAEVQETLRDLITQYGPPTASNTQMYSAVLKSALANDPREAGLIDISLDKQIPGRLFAQKIIKFL